MLMTVITALGGGLLRMLPELLALFNKRTDNSHELAMLERQLALEVARSKNRTDEIEHLNRAALSEGQMRGDIDMALKRIDLHKDALKGQMQKTGIRIVDILNFLVRPVVTYYFLAMHGLTKAAMFAIALNGNVPPWEAILKIWSLDDAAILSGIISFWFVGRVFDKKQ